MGALLDQQLRQPPPSPYASAQVAAIALGGKASATLLVEERLVEEKQSSWQYGDEIPIKVGLNEPKSITLPFSGEDLFWSGIEVRVLRDAVPGFGEPGRNHYICAALYPPSFMWYFNAPLRPGLDRDKFPDWQDRLRQLAAGEIHISQLPFDPFETDPGWLFARLGDPMRPHWRVDARDLGDGARILPNRTARPRRRKGSEGDFSSEELLSRKWFFGLCPDIPDKIAPTLFQQYQDFQDRAASGAFPPRRRGLAGQSERQVGKRSEGGGIDHADRRQMGIAAAAPLPGQDTSDDLLNGAICQALAGRDNPCITLSGQIGWRFFRNSFRDRAQRLLTLYERLNREERKRRQDATGAEPETDADEQEPILRELLALHPELAELAPNGRLDIGTLTELARKSPDDPRLATLHRFLWERIRSQK